MEATNTQLDNIHYQQGCFERLNRICNMQNLAEFKFLEVFKLQIMFDTLMFN